MSGGRHLCFAAFLTVSVAIEPVSYDLRTGNWRQPNVDTAGSRSSNPTHFVAVGSEHCVFDVDLDQDSPDVGVEFYSWHVANDSAEPALVTDYASGPASGASMVTAGQTLFSPIGHGIVPVRSGQDE